MLERMIKRVAPPGTVIPKPQARRRFIVKGEGMRKRQRALIYTIPNHSNPKTPYEKGITYLELERACQQLQRTGQLTLGWFLATYPSAMPKAAATSRPLAGYSSFQVRLRMLGEECTLNGGWEAERYTALAESERLRSATSAEHVTKIIPFQPSPVVGFKPGGSAT
jgi:hypothetical protein